MKNALLEEGVVLEEFGGETQCAVISAKTGDGVEDLLEKVMLQVRCWQQYILRYFSQIIFCCS